jgi:hypothetical protein
MKSCAILHFACNRNVFRAILTCAFLSSVACSTIFDAPPGSKDLGAGKTAKMIDDLTSITEQDVTEAVSSRVKEVGISAQASATTATTNPDRKGLSFERVDAEMPQLAVQQGFEKAVVLVDGERIGLGGLTRAGHIGLIAPGRHVLRVECPYDPPFSADFKVVKGDRVVLRGKCSPTKPAPAATKPVPATTKPAPPKV